MGESPHLRNPALGLRMAWPNTDFAFSPSRGEKVFNHTTRAIRRRMVERKPARFFCVELSIW